MFNNVVIEALRLKELYLKQVEETEKNQERLSKERLACLVKIAEIDRIIKIEENSISPTFSVN